MTGKDDNQVAAAMAKTSAGSRDDKLRLTDKDRSEGLSSIDASVSKDTENQLRWMFNVFHAAADPIIIEDLAGRVIEVNAAAECAFDWPRNELLGQKTTILVPDDARKAIARLRTRCRRSEHVRDVETVLCRRSGKTLPVSLTMSRLSDATTSPGAVAWIAKDITRRKRAEQQRQRYAAQLEATNQQLRENIERRKAAEAEALQHARRREEFLAMLSHELRNPFGRDTHCFERVGSGVVGRNGSSTSASHPKTGTTNGPIAGRSVGRVACDAWQDRHPSGSRQFDIAGR